MLLGRTCVHDNVPLHEALRQRREEDSGNGVRRRVGRQRARGNAFAQNKRLARAFFTHPSGRCQCQYKYKYCTVLHLYKNQQLQLHRGKKKLKNISHRSDSPFNSEFCPSSHYKSRLSSLTPHQLHRCTILDHLIRRARALSRTFANEREKTPAHFFYKWCLQLYSIRASAARRGHTSTCTVQLRVFS